MHPAKLAARIETSGSISLESAGRPDAAPRPSICYAWTTELERNKTLKRTFVRNLKAIELANETRPFLLVDRRQVAADALIAYAGIKRGQRMKEAMPLRGKIRRANGDRTVTPRKKYPATVTDDDLQYLSGLLDFRCKIVEDRLLLQTADPEIVFWLQSKFGGRAYRNGVYSKGQNNGWPKWHWSTDIAGATWLPDVIPLVEIDEKREALEAAWAAAPVGPKVEVDPKTLPQPGDNDYRSLRRWGKTSREEAMRETGVTLERAEWIDFANGYGSL